MNKSIYLITTPGCMGCKIMSNILRDISKTYKITLKIGDVSEFDDSIKIHVEDFPTMILIVDGTIVHKTCGSMNANKVVDILRNCKFV